MLHGGFTYKLGTLRAQCSVEGNQEFDKVASELGVPFKRTGKLVVGFTEHDRQNILRFKANGEANGVQRYKFLKELMNEDNFVINKSDFIKDLFN